MTAIAFHFNAPAPLAYACRLLRKALSNGAKVVATGSPNTLRQLDADLWALSPTDFLAHSLLEGEPHVVAASPLILASSLGSTPHQQVLLNLGPAVPAGFERFERVIEVVGLEDQDRQSARARWRHYLKFGYTITRHDLHLRASDQ